MAWSTWWAIVAAIFVFLDRQSHSHPAPKRNFCVKRSVLSSMSTQVVSRRSSRADCKTTLGWNLGERCDGCSRPRILSDRRRHCYGIVRLIGGVLRVGSGKYEREVKEDEWIRREGIG